MATVTVACAVRGGLILQPQTTAFKWPIVLDGPRGHEAGHKLTTVDADFFAEWLASYASSPVVLSGAVFQTS